MRWATSLTISFVTSVVAEAGNPAPEYKQVEFMVKVKLTSALRDEDETTEKNGRTF
jgi:hypothetical protein